MINRFSKSILVLGVASLLTAGATFAGNGNGAGDGTGLGGGKGMGKSGPDTEQPGGPAFKMARISDMLGLTAEQEDAILAFFRDREAEREAMRDRIMETFGEEICAQRAANEGAFEDLLFAILDADQLALHEEMKATREARQAERQGRNGGGRLECPAPIEG